MIKKIKNYFLEKKRRRIWKRTGRKIEPQRRIEGILMPENKFELLNNREEESLLNQKIVSGFKNELQDLKEKWENIQNQINSLKYEQLKLKEVIKEVEEVIRDWEDES